MTGDFYVGQAIVTDPLLDGASGYTMTAVSDSVAAEDRAHLTELPQVSDYMHVEQGAHSFLSFHRLPSGCWALSHRFVQGTRRRAYNRVVVHTLVVSGELLEAVADDAWLLVAACRYLDPEGDWRLFRDLAAFVGEPGVLEVSDLQVRLPERPWESRYAMLQGRCEFLRSFWGSEETFCQALALVLEAIEAGGGFLLPQEPAMEQLLALAWSALPRQDRLRVAWTTHLGMGGDAIFRLALAPRPADARYQMSDPDHWALLDGSPMCPGGAGEALARIVALRFTDFPAIDEGLARYRITLDQHLGMLRWMQLMAEGGSLPPNGFQNARDLEAFFGRHHFVGEVSLQVPGLMPDMVLTSIALTVVNQYQREGSWNNAVQAVSQVIAARELGAFLLDPDQVVETVRRGKSGRDAQEAMAALALFLASPDWKIHQTSRERLLEAVQERGSLAQAAGLESTPVFFQLAMSLTQFVPEKAEAAYRVVHQNGGLAIALKSLEARPGHLIHLRAILRVARGAGDRAVAGKVACEFLVPLLAKDPAQARVDKLGDDVLKSLQAAPEGLVQAFAEWKDGDLYDDAVKTLKQWAGERSSSALAVAERLASETDNGVSDLIRERPSILGTARALADAGAPAAHWLPFALAEAAVIDGSGSSEQLQVFREFLGKATIQEKRIEHSVTRLLGRFHRMPPVAKLGPAHRALVTRLASLLGRHPGATNALSQLASNLPADPADLLLWGEAIAAVAVAVAGRDPRSASQMVRNWWTGLTIAAVQLDVHPAGAYQSLNLLTSQDAAAVLDQWVPKFPTLGTDSRGQALLGAFEALARKHGLRDQEFLCEVGRLARSLGRGEGSLESAVEITARRASELRLSEAQLTTALSKLLPLSMDESLKAILELLVSPSMLDVTKAFMEKKLLDRVLEQSRGLPMVLPPLERLAEYPSLLSKVARRMGRSWPQWPDDARSFVRRLAELERFDVLGAFFRGVEDSGSNFISYTERCEPSLIRTLRYAARHPMGRVALNRVKSLRD